MAEGGSAGEPVLRVRGLTKRYGDAAVVDDVTFELYPGEVLTLLGPSGCGKSTTLRMIAGLEQPDAGEVWVRGRLVASPAARVMVPPEARNLGLVFQSYAIWPHMSVAENVAYPLRVRRRARKDIEARVADMLRLVRLDGLGDRMSAELSGGQQQRVALARAMIYEPDLLLLDEPLSNLDAVLRKEVRAQIRALQRRLASTLLYVTHDQEEAMSLSNRVVVMNRGRVEQIDAPERVYERPATRFVQEFVGRTVRLRGVLTGTAAAPRVRIGLGEIEVAPDEDVVPDGGGRVEISVRPEDIALSRAGQPGLNVVAGDVVEVTYYGDRLECVIRIDGDGDQRVVIDAGKREAVSIGDKVLLTIDATRLRSWPS